MNHFLLVVWGSSAETKRNEILIITIFLQLQYTKGVAPVTLLLLLFHISIIIIMIVIIIVIFKIVIIIIIIEIQKRQVQQI